MSKPNISIQAAGALLALCVVSGYLLAGMYAKYTTTAPANDGARVASFHVEVLGGEDVKSSIGLQDDSSNSTRTARYSYSVQNTSEVAIRYSVTFVFDQPIPKGITVPHENDTVAGDGAVRTVTVQDPGFILAPGATSPLHHIDFQTQFDTLAINYNPTVQVKVTATQID